MRFPMRLVLPLERQPLASLRWMMNEYGKEGPVPVHIKGKSSTKPLIDTGALRQNCQYVIKKGKK